MIHRGMYFLVVSDLYRRPRTDQVIGVHFLMSGDGVHYDDREVFCQRLGGGYPPGLGNDNVRCSHKFVDVLGKRKDPDLLPGADVCKSRKP